MVFPALPTLWMLSWTALFGAGLLLPLAGRLIGGGRWQARAVDVSILLALLGSLAGVAGAVAAMVTPDRWAGTTDVLVLLQGAWDADLLPDVTLQIRLDSLSAGFVLLTAAFAALVAVYSFGALRAPYFQRQKAWIAGAFNLFVWGTLMVVIVNDLLSLIIVLEIMTLAFGCLTLYKHDHYQDPQEHAPSAEQRKDARLAPQIYMIISHTSTAFLLAAFLLLVRHANGLSFDDLRRAAGLNDATSQTIIFLLLVAGLGIRAGLTPAHFWVSLVHPASPTSTHAFSLGIAIKVAIYLMIRFFFQFLEPQAAWGYLLLGLAVVTAVVNVWYAIASHDLKKALAYHSIENVGIIVAGIGAALIFQANGLTAFAVAAMAAGLFHLLNHAVFKGLLYLSTGAIERLTDQVVDIERLGGLLKIWPWTAGAFLVGAISIAGFPPFNGFISEWLTLQALLDGLQGEHLGLSGELALVLSIMGLVASFALTAFCFLKITGLALLGQPRTEAATVEAWRRTPDVPWSMRGTMLLLAALCLLIGVFPTPMLRLLERMATEVLGLNTLGRGIELPQKGLQIDAAQLLQQMPNMFYILAAGSLLALGAWGISRMRLRRRVKTVQPVSPWNCGTPYASAQMQYTGAALSFLIRDLFGAGWASEGRRMPGDFLPASLPMSEGAAGSRPQARQVVTEAFRVAYNHVIGWLLRASARVEMFFQNGDIRRYLAYILVANLVVLLLFLALERQG